MKDRNKRFKIFRTKILKMSQIEMAEFLSQALTANINQSNISEAEAGRRPIPDDWVSALHFHKLLNYEWYYGGSESPQLESVPQKKLMTDTAEMREEIGLLNAKVRALSSAVDKLWALAYPDEK